MIKFLEKLVVSMYRRAEAKAQREAEKADAKARGAAEEARRLAQAAEDHTKQAVANKSLSILHSVKAEKLEEFFGKF